PTNATLAKAAGTGTIQNDDHQVAQPGHYEDKDSQNELIAMDVNADGVSLTNLHTGQTNEFCNDGASLYGGYLNYGTSVFPIAGDGSFSVNSAGTGSVSGFPSTYTIAINGTFSGASASGTLVVTTSFDAGGTHYSCTSGSVTWTAPKTG